MIKLILCTGVIIYCLLTSCVPQKLIGEHDIKEIWVYKPLVGRGFTTASAYSHFRRIEQNSATIKVKLDNSLKDSLNVALCKLHINKTFQEKTGQNLIFCQFHMRDGSIRDILIAPNSILDYYEGRTAYFAKSDSETVFFEELYNRIIKELELQTDSESK